MNKSNNIMDQPIPKIHVSILKPTHLLIKIVSSLKYLAIKVVDKVNIKINDFLNWFLSYIPEPRKNEINERITRFKDQFN